MIILDGKIIADKTFELLRREIKTKKLQLKLAVILVGDNPVSKIYVKEKEKACRNIGIDFELFVFPMGILEKELEEKIKKISENPQNSGVVIQLPLPKNFSTQEIINLVPPEKDIDVLSEKTRQIFAKGESTIFPPVVGAVKKLLDEYSISLKDKKIVLIGSGRLVGEPLAIWLASQKINYSIINTKTENINAIIKEADVIISGVGKPKFITGQMVKQESIAIDAGTSCEGCKSSGDFDFETVSEKASYITPVPGGVGPLTVATLLENLVKLNTNKK